MLERAFARTFSNFSTLFMIVAIVVFPVHLLYAFAFRGVIATSAYHDAIAAGPPSRRVEGVGPGELDRARLTFWVLTAAELAAVPLAVRAARRVFSAEDDGVPTAADGWRHALGRGGVPPAPAPLPGPALVGLAVAVVVGGLLYAIGRNLTDLLTDEWRWVGVALRDGLVRAVAVPFLLGPLALARAKEGAPSAPKLY